jgi:hypothetical protein
MKAELAEKTVEHLKHEGRQAAGREAAIAEKDSVLQGEERQRRQGSLHPRRVRA